VVSVDKYTEWKRDGVLKRNLAFIAKSVSEGGSILSISQALKIGNNTLARMKEEYPDVLRAFDKGNDKLRETLYTALVKKAKGYTHTLTKRKYNVNEAGVPVLVSIEENEIHYAPDMNAIEYLLVVRFGESKIPTVMNELEDNYTKVVEEAMSRLGDKDEAI
jgi:hypothetical protein